MFESLSNSLQRVFAKWGKDRLLTAENIRDGLEEIRKALLEADVHFEVARALTDAVTQRAVGQEVIAAVKPAEQIVKIFSDVLTEAMHGEPPKIPLTPGQPAVVMLVGLQGSGKTTTIGKLARKLKRQGRKPLLVAADTRRPAAITQLQVLGKAQEISVYSEEGPGNEDRAPQICANAVARAKKEGHDVVLLDTAGRLHIDAPLMDELARVEKLVAPHVTLLVCDSMAGQDAYTSAREFHGKLRLDGVILTKLDGDTRGGAAISVKQVTGKPIVYIGTGERPEDLDDFHADRMASRILGMGDVVSLVEKAQEVIDEDEAQEATERLLKAQFTLDDFLNQLRSIRKMGSLKGLLKMMPGQIGQAFEQAGVQEKELVRVEAAILSMTLEERRRPELLDANRRRRVARGSGNELSVVNQLIRQHEQMRDMMKRFQGGGMLSKLGSLFGGAGSAGGGGAGGGGAGGLAGMAGMGGMPGMQGAGGSRRQQELMAQMARGGGEVATKDPIEEARRRAARKREKESRKKNRKRR
ncbi:MAG: signal recognition particle protein [Planctomycetes bacterium]|nr:signal recognition particle protein [Planctomycetota bacterium]